MNLNNSNSVSRGSVEAESNSWSVDTTAWQISTVLIPDASNLGPHVNISKTGSSSEYFEDKKALKAESLSRPLKLRRVLEVARIFGILCWAFVHCPVGHLRIICSTLERTGKEVDGQLNEQAHQKFQLGGGSTESTQ